MEPGQVNWQLGATGAFGERLLAMAATEVRVPFSHKTAAWVSAGAMRLADGFDLRDTQLGVLWQPVYGSKGTARFRLGASVPTGSIQQRVAFTPLSSSSFDPVAGADVVYGGLWLFTGSFDVRTPLYKGRDGRTQGSFGRVDAALARRYRSSVFWTGLSAASQARSSSGDGQYAETSAIVGAVVPPTERLAITTTLRVPFLWAGDTRPYAIAASVSMSWVIGNPPEDHEH